MEIKQNLHLMLFGEGHCLLNVFQIIIQLRSLVTVGLFCPGGIMQQSKSYKIRPVICKNPIRCTFNAQIFIDTVVIKHLIYIRQVNAKKKWLYRFGTIVRGRVIITTLGKKNRCKGKKDRQKGFGFSIASHRVSLLL